MKTVKFVVDGAEIELLHPDEYKGLAATPKFSAGQLIRAGSPTPNPFAPVMTVWGYNADGTVYSVGNLANGNVISYSGPDSNFTVFNPTTDTFPVCYGNSIPVGGGVTPVNPNQPVTK